MHPSKPHLCYRHGVWLCGLPAGRYFVDGSARYERALVGATPLDAYLQWVKVVLENSTRRS